MGGTPPPFAENSAKIINLIFEPFPKCLFASKKLWISRWILHLELKFSIFLNSPSNGLFKKQLDLILRPKGSWEIGKKQSGDSFLRHPVFYFDL